MAIRAFKGLFLAFLLLFQVHAFAQTGESGLPRLENEEALSRYEATGRAAYEKELTVELFVKVMKWFDVDHFYGVVTPDMTKKAWKHYNERNKGKLPPKVEQLIKRPPSHITEARWDTMPTEQKLWNVDWKKLPEKVAAHLIIFSDPLIADGYESGAKIEYWAKALPLKKDAPAWVKNGFQFYVDRFGDAGALEMVTHKDMKGVVQPLKHFKKLSQVIGESDEVFSEGVAVRSHHANYSDKNYTESQWHAFSQQWNELVLFEQLNYKRSSVVLTSGFPFVPEIEQRGLIRYTAEPDANGGPANYRVERRQHRTSPEIEALEVFELASHPLPEAKRLMQEKMLKLIEADPNILKLIWDNKNWVLMECFKEIKQSPEFKKQMEVLFKDAPAERSNQILVIRLQMDPSSHELQAKAAKLTGNDYYDEHILNVFSETKNLCPEAVAALKNHFAKNKMSESVVARQLLNAFHNGNAEVKFEDVVKATFSVSENSVVVVKEILNEKLPVNTLTPKQVAYLANALSTAIQYPRANNTRELNMEYLQWAKNANPKIKEVRSLLSLLTTRSPFDGVRLSTAMYLCENDIPLSKDEMQFVIKRIHEQYGNNRLALKTTLALKAAIGRHWGMKLHYFAISRDKANPNLARAVANYERLSTEAGCIDFALSE